MVEEPPVALEKVRPVLSSHPSAQTQLSEWVQELMTIPCTATISDARTRWDTMYVEISRLNLVTADELGKMGVKLWQMLFEHRRIHVLHCIQDLHMPELCQRVKPFWGLGFWILQLSVCSLPGQWLGSVKPAFGDNQHPRPLLQPVATWKLPPNCGHNMTQVASQLPPSNLVPLCPELHHQSEWLFCWALQGRPVRLRSPGAVDWEGVCSREWNFISAAILRE